MEITEDEFNRYVKVQKSGVTNMFAVNVVSRLSKLNRDQIFYIMENYDKLSDKFSIVT